MLRWRIRERCNAVDWSGITNHGAPTATRARPPQPGPQSQPGHEITSIVSTPSPAASVYDAVGNMTTMPSPDAWATAYTCKWNAWNRLVQVVQGGSEIAAYRYHAITRRIVKTVDEESYHFYYNRQWRTLEERLEGAVKSRYVWSPFDHWNLIRRQRVTSGSIFNETYFVLRDYLDPVAIVDGDGVVTERCRYEAFGPATKLSPTFTTSFTSDADWTWLFHSEFIDLETDLYNYGYRYYHPQLGRWISRDPLREEGGLNLYGFVQNNPMDKIDVFGEKPALSYKTTSKNLTVKCDSEVKWSIEWILKDHGKFGTIDQLIEQEGVIRGCATGDELPQNSTWIEFWPINDKGNIGSNLDEWIVPIFNNTCGWITTKSSAVFAASSVIPANALTDPQRAQIGLRRVGSGNLRSVTLPQYNQNNTPFSDLSNMVSREMKVWWNCCKKGDKGSIDFTP